MPFTFLPTNNTGYKNAGSLNYCPGFPLLQLGGAMAPAIKELSRWLDANSEYYVAPDWADVVKHSVSTTHFNVTLYYVNVIFVFHSIPTLQFVC